MVAGCVSYRGYYKEADAKKTEAALKAQGLETQVYGVPAYSTLGKLNWLGGDPLLNTFLNYPDVEMARLVFHELAHQVLYVNDDTTFNESFATAVERIGTDLWLAERGNPEARRVFEEREARQKQWRALQMRTRDRLSVVYAKNIEKKSTLPSVSIDSVAAISIANNSDWKAQKTAVMADFQREYLVLKASWNDYSGYDASAARANNASIGSAAAYDELVPQFLAVYEKQGRSMSAFYDAIKALVALPREDRRRALAAAANP
jgi:predicted aminopeptidase